MEARDFTNRGLLGSDGVYREFYKSDEYQGFGHATDGIDFTTTCVAGHANTTKVAPDRIQKSAGKNIIKGEMPRTCGTCGIALTKSWLLAPKTESVSSFSEWLGR